MLAAAFPEKDGISLMARWHLAAPRHRRPIYSTQFRFHCLHTACAFKVHVSTGVELYRNSVMFYLLALASEVQISNAKGNPIYLRTMVKATQKVVWGPRHCCHGPFTGSPEGDSALWPDLISWICPGTPPFSPKGGANLAPRWQKPKRSFMPTADLAA